MFCSSGFTAELLNYCDRKQWRGYLCHFTSAETHQGTREHTHLCVICVIFANIYCRVEALTRPSRTMLCASRRKSSNYQQHAKILNYILKSLKIRLQHKLGTRRFGSARRRAFEPRACFGCRLVRLVHTCGHVYIHTYIYIFMCI